MSFLCHCVRDEGTLLFPRLCLNATKIVTESGLLLDFSALGDGGALGSGRSRFESQLKHLPNELRWRDFHSQTFRENVKCAPRAWYIVSLQQVIPLSSPLNLDLN